MGSSHLKGKLIKKGEILNVHGRKGKDGMQGKSLKTSFKHYLNTLDDDAMKLVWFGLLCKCQTGDVNSIKLLIELNDELVNDNAKAAEASTTQVVINIPKQESE